MKKMRKIFAVLLTLAMVLAMSIPTFAAKVTDGGYKNKITVTNLAADVETTLNVYNIIYLDETDGNQTWQVVEWAAPYISEDTATGKFSIINESGLKDAADKQPAADYTVKENGTSHDFTELPIGAYVIRAFDAKGTYGLMVANTYDKDQTYMASKPADQVIAKIEKYKTTKETSDKFVHRGQTVNFKVTAQMAPKKGMNNKELKTFKVVDTSTGLKSDSFKITKITIAGTEKTVAADKVKTEVKDGGKVEFTVDLSEFIKDTAAGATIVVEYSAVVENERTYNNSATANGESVEYEGTTVNGYSGKVSLKKVDAAKEEQVLNGAEFQLLKVTPATEEGAEPTKTPVSVVNVKTGEYKVALEGEADATTTLVATNGTLKVTGLDEGDYEFKETKAPKGYKVKPENEKFTIEANEKEEVDAGEIMFKDTKLSALPSTGGIGTTIFTIAGCLIMVTAAGLFFASRKRTNK